MGGAINREMTNYHTANDMNTKIKENPRTMIMTNHHIKVRIRT